MPGRKYSTDKYRYGFNRQEKSIEISPNSYTAEFWQYDTKIGRRWNIDPVVKVWESPYATFSNNPILFSDPNGADAGGGEDPVTTKKTMLEGVTLTSKISKKQAAINSVKAFNPIIYVDFNDRFTLDQFKTQLIDRINNPYGMDQGHKTKGYNKGGTNFCWAAAASSFQYERDPQMMAKFMMDLFAKGKGDLGGISVDISRSLINAVGSNVFNNDGGLKKSQIDQLLFLGLAGSMKDYVNLFRMRYYPEAEDGRWASGTFAKFNALMKLYSNTVVTSQGSDLSTPGVTFQQILNAQKNGEKIFLFVYNAHFKEPKESTRGTDMPFSGGYPTGPSGSHFVQIRNVTISGEKIYMDIWDYGDWRPHQYGINQGQLMACTYGILTVK